MPLVRGQSGLCVFPGLSQWLGKYLPYDWEDAFPTAGKMLSQQQGKYFPNSGEMVFPANGKSRFRIGEDIGLYHGLNGLMLYAYKWAFRMNRYYYSD